MKYAKTLFTSLFLFFTIIGYSQTEKHLIGIEKLINKTESLDFKRDFYVKGIWDNRLFKDNIGFVQKGLGNRKVVADFEDNISSVLLDYFSQEYPAKIDQQTPIEMVVQNFWISEATGALSETGRADMTVVFCQKNEKGDFNALFTFQDFIETGGMDVTAGHPKRIRQLLNKAFIEFQKSDWKYLKQPELFHFQRLDSTNNILSATIKRKGGYRTFQEFFNNTPTDTATVFIVEPIDENRVNILDPNKSARRLRLYGYSDGENIYINSNNYSYDQSHYAKIHTLGRYSLVKDKTFSVLTSSIMTSAFGLLGYLASTGMKNKMEAIIDTKTGLSMPLTYDVLKSLLAPYPQYSKSYEIAYQHGNRSTELMKTFINELNKEYDISIGKRARE
ncbi:hypothetical protein LV89_04460 [Arcicella aurantiaca]|uniref:Uncharacterized protein n=1 Tax=Arcicella aurantiaca TaxID=591202 RepID=A0A316DGC5_9BACT|nr:hypothetical protein [Arcicella aurantiaca]PWK17174.1 hypothetical protein LV89_04460 [Arcicella aurantiaca]